MATFLEELKEQRWDDHRYYHHSRINQSLHLVSACSFLVTYGLLFTYPVAAALFGWMFAMCSRQVGHFFFEPKGYDEVNQATHEYKEEIKVGYNLRRKVVLHVDLGRGRRCCSASIRRCSGSVRSRTPDDLAAICTTWRRCGWRSAAAALLFRTVHLFFPAGRADRAWCGSPRSSPTRSTTSCSTTGAAAPAARRADRARQPARVSSRRIADRRGRWRADRRSAAP